MMNPRRQTHEPEATEALSIRIPVALARALRLRQHEGVLTKKELVLGILLGDRPPITAEELRNADWS